MANELCFSSTCKLNNSFIPTVFFHDLSFLCSIIVSHPLYFSYFIFFSPYLFKFIFFISPLFFTTSIVLILSVIATTFPQSKLGFVQTMVDKLRSKMNDVDEDDEFLDFEEFEIFKIVFRDPPLVTVGDGEDEQTVAKSEKERSLERLFEELDRFEDSTVEIKEVVGEFQKLEPMARPISVEDQKSDENSFSVKSNPWRLDSSSSFGSCESIGDATPAIEMKENELKSYIEEIAGELQKLEPVKVAFSGEEEKTVQNAFSVKSNSTVSIEMNENAKSYIEEFAGELRKIKSVNVSSSGEGKKSVRNSFSTISYPTSSNEMNDNIRRSYIEEVTGQLQKLAPVKVSSTREDEKTVCNSLANQSKSTAAIETKENETGSHVRRVLQKLESSAISVSSDDKKSVQNSWRSDSSSSFGSYGSMRKEKEWKRTLACKLFEERNNSSGGEEGMDSLWESYEEDNASIKSKNRKQSMINEKKTIIKNKKNSEFKYFDEHEDEDDDDEDEFMNNGQLCCLKALKLSTGKMNLGMGKPNLVKITKALKGFGWIHHVGSKHGKKH